MSGEPEHLHDLFRQALRGELADARARIDSLAAGTPAERACSLALQAALDPELDVTPATATELLGRDPGTHEAVALLAATLGSRAARRHCIADVQAWASLLVGCGGSYAAVATSVLAAFAAWLGAGAAPSEDELEGAARTARDEGHADLLVELQCACALLELDAGRLAEGRARARSGVRMAQAEQLPAQELLAHLTLARVRRHEGQPHLAARILHSVARYVPEHARQWLEWEQRMVAAGPPTVGTPLGTLQAALVANDQVEAALRGLQRAPLAAPFRRDAERMSALVSGTGSAAGEQAAWREGKTSELPPGLAGLALHSHERLGDATPASALMLVGPEIPARRLPPLAAHFQAGLHQASTELLAAPWHPRTETGLAVLAWHAAEPMLTDDYFYSVFGIRYEQALHGSMLATHLLRARERVGSAAVIERTGAGIVFRPSLPLILRDPTCTESLDQQALRFIGAAGGTSAMELAQALGLPLRTAQRLLQSLVTEGLALGTKTGRSVVYDVEDTVFAESTLARMLSVLRS